MFGKKIKLLVAVMFMMSCSHVCVSSKEREVQNGMTHAVKIVAEMRAKRLSLTKKEASLVNVGWSGSGVVLSAGKSGLKDLSVVMTADHVIDVPTIVQGEDEDGAFIDFPDASTLKINAITLDSRVCDATILERDSLHDIATLTLNCIAGVPVDLAESLPPKGGELQAVGSPMGIRTKGTFIVTRGEFMGTDGTSQEMLLTTVPVIGGSSGSGVFYDGKVVGIVDRVYTEFHHVSKMVNLKWCQKLYYESLLKLHE